MPEITTSEIRYALKHLKIREAPGRDRVTTEILKTSGIELENYPKTLF